MGWSKWRKNKDKLSVWKAKENTQKELQIYPITGIGIHP